MRPASRPSYLLRSWLSAGASGCAGQHQACGQCASPPDTHHLPNDRGHPCFRALDQPNELNPNTWLEGRPRDGESEAGRQRRVYNFMNDRSFAGVVGSLPPDAEALFGRR
jgi:hypothetical protein